MSQRDVEAALVQALGVERTGRTEYLLVLGKSGAGVVDPETKWVAEGSNFIATALLAYYHLETWTGDTNACVMATNQIAGVFAPRAITANFAENLAVMGTPHWRLAQYGLTNGGTSFDAAETNDLDGDRMQAWQEYVASTDPTNKDSVLKITGVGLDGGEVRSDWKGGRSVWQFLERSQDLGKTTDVREVVFTNVPPTSVATNVLDPAATNRMLFYRIRAQRQ